MAAPVRDREALQRLNYLFQVLEALVAVVATLGELAATVTRGDTVCPESLRDELWKFTRTLRDNLRRHRSVTSLRHHGVTSQGHHSVTSLGHHSVTSLHQRGATPLGQAVAALKATPGVTWAEVTKVGRAWLEWAEPLWETWDQVCSGAEGLCNTFLDFGEDTNGDTNNDTDVTRNLQDEAATEATRQVGRATRWAEHLEGLLGRLIHTCEAARVYPWGLQDWLGDRDTREGTQRASPGDIEFLVAAVEEFEQLWEGSARLATCHLLGTLGDIERLLSGGPGGPTVADWSQRAIGDIPRLLGGQ
ncbi:hypothetical protein HGM15179_020725 [Zosterops borbonicus]|uniref:Uncharacterized protein n=1 Tax=Zosterops borbonicus TaxID=364589 RepID=A0A8K1FUR4_9PASS|nr:hypothetical protein HGM15179_020725 [Zosterops borbonicus]